MMQVRSPHFISTFMRHFVAAFFICFLFQHSGMSQTTVETASDTSLVKEKKVSIFKGRPGKALVYSLIIPGSGQWYNGSIARAHVVWAAIGGMGYVLHYNTRQYNCIREAYIARVDKVPYTPSPKCPPDLAFNLTQITDPARLRVLRDQANADRQLAIVGFSLVWLANGIDAFVDAHLKDFDVDDDLSFRISTMADDDPFAPVRMGMFVKF